jgi:type I restriction enzyme M protein
LFTNTQIPACLWLLTKGKRARDANGQPLANRRGQFLFIDAHKIGYMKDHILRDFTPAEIGRLADTFHAWQRGVGYKDIPGICKSTILEEVRTHDHVLTPGRYVRVVDAEDDGELFATKMAWLTA